MTLWNLLGRSKTTIIFGNISVRLACLLKKETTDNLIYTKFLLMCGLILNTHLFLKVTLLNIDIYLGHLKYKQLDFFKKSVSDESLYHKGPSSIVCACVCVLRESESTFHRFSPFLRKERKHQKQTHMSAFNILTLPPFLIFSQQTPKKHESSHQNKEKNKQENKKE